MAYDEMELDMLGDQRTAMFVIISDTDDTFNFVVSILYTQLFNLLCDKADDEHGGRLPYHVRLLLDEFANIGQIPKFDKLIATIRSREISASIILQSQSQLKTIYKDAAETIIGNCDTMLFLGGKESSTLKEISETLGKETIDLYNTSDTRGNSPSFGTNYQKTGKELMSRDELAVMDGSKCILQLRGVRPFLSDKFDITKHKRYKELSDFDKKNEFDVERYLKHELRLLTTEEFDLYEVYKEKAPNVIVDASGKLVSAEIRKGLDEDARKKILDYLHPPLMEKPMNQKPSLHQMEHYQKFYENGEYVRAVESTTEQNYNMIDGCANNLPKPRIINGRESVLDKLRIRQMAREKQKSSQEQSADMERNRK